MQSRTIDELSEWLISYVANLLDIDRDSIDTRTPFERYGLDSTAAAGLSGDLGEWLGIKLDANLILQHPTIESVANHLAAPEHNPEPARR